MLTIPSRGLAHDDVLAQMEALRGRDAAWREGRVFSLVYFPGEAHYELVKKAHHLFFAENGLNPMAFQSLRRMEAEVVRMSAAMLHGGPKTVGTMTSGGTESILLAVKSARERGHATHRRLKKPNIVVPESVHVAFDKAGHYFGVEVRYANLRADKRVDVKDFESLVDDQTVLLVGSAPQYPHGVVDPIEDIARIGRRRGIPVHVDACIGGFFLPWAERLGYPIPLWDFRVQGVTSISADIHKFGFGPKGSSVIVYRDMEYLKHQFFVSTDWPGGIYASPTVAGTRPGGSIAGAWASMHAMGESGYLDHTDRAMKATAKLVSAVRAIPELELVAEPDMSIVAFTTTKASQLDVYALADKLADRDWNVDRQQHPSCIHMTMTSNHVEVIESFIEDLRTAVAYLKEHPELESRGNAAMYGMMAKVPFRGMVKQGVVEVMEKLYGPDAASDIDPMKGNDEGLVGRIMSTYGAKVLGVLDKVDRLRDRLPLKGKRRRTTA